MGTEMAVITDEAKQLDYVSNVVTEKEIDEGKAKDAITSLSSTCKVSDYMTKYEQQDKIVVRKEDVAIIMNELEVSEEVAGSTLRRVFKEKSNLRYNCGSDNKEDDTPSSLFLALYELLTISP